MSDKLNIGYEMRMFDRKVRSFYDDLTPEERKKFSNYLMIRWGSAVEGSRELQEFYLIATNERLNLDGEDSLTTNLGQWGVAPMVPTGVE